MFSEQLLAFTQSSAQSMPLKLFTPDTFEVWRSEQPQSTQNQLAAQQFRADINTAAFVYDETGDCACVCAGLGDIPEPTSISQLPLALPEAQTYHIELIPASWTADKAALSWGLGAYQYKTYKQAKRGPATLVWPCDAEQQKEVTAILQGIYAVRDLITTPALDMTPAALATVAEALAIQHDAKCHVIVGEKLLKQNFPAIYHVGKASDIAPRLIDLTWGDGHHPKVTLVGKGVCFDSGGLDIKNAQGMRTMKKDMGGSAHVLGLAHAIMALNLPIRLRVLIPAVENVVSGNAYKPGDVLPTRAGLTIEVGNTDAEGRVVLADALALACEETPALIIDMATLTGAARVALGADLPAMFCNDTAVLFELQRLSEQTADPIWPMPLFKPYERLIDTPIADVSNTGASAYGGAITAALFLQRFIAPDCTWMHFDLMAYNQSSSPGRPEGGEAMGLRTLLHFLQEKYLRA